MTERNPSIWLPESRAELSTVDKYCKGIFENIVYLSRIRTGSPAGFPILAKGFMGSDRVPATAEFFPFDPLKLQLPTAGVINYEIEETKGILMANAVWSGDNVAILATDGRPSTPQPTMRALHFVNGFLAQEIAGLIHTS